MPLSYASYVEFYYLRVYLRLHSEIPIFTALRNVWKSRYAFSGGYLSHPASESPRIPVQHIFCVTMISFNLFDTAVLFVIQFIQLMMMTSTMMMLNFTVEWIAALLRILKIQRSSFCPDTNGHNCVASHNHSRKILGYTLN
jgi:hypothetical protein